MNCDTCPHGFSPEDETCRHCPLYPEEKPATPTSNPVPTVEVPAPASPSAPAEEAGPEEIPPVLSLEDGKETAPYFPEPSADKPHVEKVRPPHHLRQKAVAILLSICLFLGSMMTCAGYMAGHALDKAPASRFLTKDTAAVLTASMPDTVYFMGIRLQKRTVQTLLLNTRIQKYLDDLISGLHTYMRTGTEPRLNYSAIATRLVRLIEQEQLLYMTSDGRTYLSETECAAILSPKLADNVRLLLVICNDELSTAVRQEALQTLTSGANLDSDKILKTVTQVQGLLHLPTRLFWGGIAVCIVSFCLLLFFNRRRKGRALLFAAIPLFLCGLLLLVVLAPPLFSSLLGGTEAALAEGGLRVLYSAVTGPAVIMLVCGCLLALAYVMDKLSLPIRLWRRIRRLALAS